MMGDRDYRGLIKGALHAIGKEVEIKIDGFADNNTIGIHEDYYLHEARIF